MRPARMVILAVVLLGSPQPRTPHVAPAVPPPPPAPEELAVARFSALGPILFVTDSATRVVDREGAVTTIGRAGEAHWDPVHPGDVLAFPDVDEAPIRRLRRDGTGWHVVETWPTRSATSFSQAMSPDGRWLAWNRTRRGRLTWTIRVQGRDGSIRELKTDRRVVSTWTPQNEVVLLLAGRHRKPIAWDPFTGAMRSFTIGRNLAAKLPAGARGGSLLFDQLSWSLDGRFFAAPAYWKQDGKPRAGVAVGTESAGIARLIPTRSGWTTPTWSPVRPEVAFLVARGSRALAGRLHVLDAATGRDQLVRTEVPVPQWVSWSPDGNWLLLPGGLTRRWHFVSRDGAVHTSTPALLAGLYPRWGEAGLNVHVPAC